jgi:hypothetical protein
LGSVEVPNGSDCVVVGRRGGLDVDSEVDVNDDCDDGAVEVEGFSWGGEQAEMAASSAVAAADRPTDRRMRDAIMRTLVDPASSAARAYTQYGTRARY